MEIERRFLVSEPPLVSNARRIYRIRQGYLAIDDVAKSSVRIRAEERSGFTLTAKAGVGVARAEESLEISKRDFERLWPLTTARIEKVRHEIPEGDLVFEFDDFTDLPLQMVEVEFQTVGQSEQFVPPAWFGREVTDDSRYTNARIARDGVPSDGGKRIT